MFRFIGGPARCGKTTLAKRAEALHSGQIISLDNLRHAFEPLATEAIRATLTVAPKESEHTPEEWLAVLRERDSVMWKGIKEYLKAADEDNDDVLMEGNVWPDYMAELDKLNFAYRAVFLVDTSPNHADRLVIAAQDPSTHNNWHRERGEEWIRHWATYNIERSKLFKQLALEYNQPVFDIADAGIEQAQTAALTHLFPDTNG